LFQAYQKAHLRIANGLIQIKPNVKYFTETGIVFEDESKYENVDAVIFATGYYIGGIPLIATLGMIQLPLLVLRTTLKITK
jgi:hypothetical protein